jgi:hypothetical protein
VRYSSETLLFRALALYVTETSGEDVLRYNASFVS